MKKIVIIGSPGAGKSTLAQALGRILAIEVIHLDYHFWQPGWKEYSRENRIEIEQRLIRGKDRWIIEGTYLSSSDSRLQAADTIIFLDMPSSLCLWQAVKRYNIYQGLDRPDISTRPDIPVGCKEKLGLFYILKILGFPYKGRKLLLDKIMEIQSFAQQHVEGKNYLICRSHEISADFLQMLSYQQHMVHVAEEEAVPVLARS